MNFPPYGLPASSDSSILMNPDEVRELSVAFDELKHRLQSVQGQSTSMQFDAELSRLESMIVSFQFQSVRAILEEGRAMAEEAAKQQSKTINVVLDESCALAIPRQYQSILHQILVHGIRNSLDHGIRESGCLILRATFQNGVLKVELEDDGRGLDTVAILASAVQAGKMDAVKALKLTEEEIIELVFENGVSSRGEPTEWSGRGIGLDSVRAAVVSARGTIQLQKCSVHGCVLQVCLPLNQVRLRVRESVENPNFLEVAPMKRSSDSGSDAEHIGEAAVATFSVIDPSWKLRGPKWLKEIPSHLVLMGTPAHGIAGGAARNSAGSFPFLILKPE